MLILRALSLVLILSVICSGEVEKVDKLKSFGFEPVVVFDGCLSERTRKGTAANPEKKRRENYEKYVASLNGGKVV